MCRRFYTYFYLTNFNIYSIPFVILPSTQKNVILNAYITVNEWWMADGSWLPIYWQLTTHFMCFHYIRLKCWMQRPINYRNKHTLDGYGFGNRQWSVIVGAAPKISIFYIHFKYNICVDKFMNFHCLHSFISGS